MLIDEKKYKILQQAQEITWCDYLSDARQLVNEEYCYYIEPSVLINAIEDLLYEIDKQKEDYKEELEYLSYYNKQIEMKIIISNNQVFYKVLDLFNIDKRILNKSDIYFYKDEIFLELKSRIDFVLLGNL